MTDRQGGTSSFNYSTDDNLTSQVLGDGVTQSFSYTNEMLTGISATKGTNTYTNFGYSYVNPATSKTTGLIYQMTDASNNVWKYTWDPSGEDLTSAVETNGSTQLASYAYAIDPAGNKTSQTIKYGTSAAQKTCFTFYPAEIIKTKESVPSTGACGTGTTNENFNYDGAGQWTSADDNGSPTKTTLLTLAYNNEGQLTSTTKAGETTPYDASSYNGLGQLTGTQNAQDTWTYGQSTGSTDRITHTNTQTQATISDNSLTTLPDGSILSERITQNGSTNTYYPLTDATGSVVGLSYADSGGTVHTVDQCAYGAQGDLMNGSTPCASQQVENPFGYAGQFYNSRLGMYQVAGGLQDPSTGQTPGCHDSGPTDPGEDYCGEDEPSACGGVCSSATSGTISSGGGLQGLARPSLSVTCNWEFRGGRGGFLLDALAVQVTVTCTPEFEAIVTVLQLQLQKRESVYIEVIHHYELIWEPKETTGLNFSIAQFINPTTFFSDVSYPSKRGVYRIEATICVEFLETGQTKCVQPKPATKGYTFP